MKLTNVVTPLKVAVTGLVLGIAGYVLGWIDFERQTQLMKTVLPPGWGFVPESSVHVRTLIIGGFVLLVLGLSFGLRRTAR